jgi:hypothetical protein
MKYNISIDNFIFKFIFLSIRFYTIGIIEILESFNIILLYHKFHENSVGLLNKQLRPIGTRVLGPVLHELRKSKFMKIASISQGFI